MCKTLDAGFFVYLLDAYSLRRGSLHGSGLYHNLRLYRSLLFRFSARQSIASRGILWLVAPSIGQAEKPCPTHKHLREHPGTTDDTVFLKITASRLPDLTTACLLFGQMLDTSNPTHSIDEAHNP